MIKSVLRPIFPVRALVSSNRGCPRYPAIKIHHHSPARIASNTNATIPLYLRRCHSAKAPPASDLERPAEYGRAYAFGPVFLSSLEESCRHAKVTSISSEQLRLVTEEAKAIQTQLSDPSDPIARTVNIEFMAHMVGAYRILKKNSLSTPQIRQLLEDAIHRAVQPASEFIRADLDSSPDPFSSVVGQSREKEQNFYIAPDFEMKRVRDEPGSYHIRVKKCWYMDTLQKLGAREIGPTFCTFDRAWYDCIDPNKHGFKFTRPKTIAEGADSCAFNFDRITTRPEPKPSE